MKKSILTMFCNMIAVAAMSQNYSITATRPYQGSTSSGDYTIFSINALSLSQVDKPIIIVEGYDNKNLVPGTATYTMYNLQATNFLNSQLTAMGYDIIVEIPLKLTTSFRNILTT